MAMKIAMLVLGFVVCFSGLLIAQASDTVALGTFLQGGDDPRQAYLAPVIEGLLMYDLSEKAGVELVDRRNMAKLVAEQELSLTGLTDAATVLRVGKLLLARYLVFGTYTLLDGEIFLIVQLSDAQTGETVVFRERGKTEHVVHLAAERLVRRLNGRVVVLADASNNRSLVLLKDDTPGSLALHSRINGAKIYIDNEFAGFTKGDERTAIIFDRLSSGMHTVRTSYAHGWGVFQTPELKFVEWQVSVEVKPGRQTAVLDETYQFYDAVEILKVVGKDRRQAALLRPELLKSDKSIQYMLVNGVERKVRVLFSPLRDPAGTYSLKLQAELQEPGKTTVRLERTFTMPVPGAVKLETTLALGDLSIKIELGRDMSAYRLTWDLVRNDIDEEALKP